MPAWSDTLDKLERLTFWRNHGMVPLLVVVSRMFSILRPQPNVGDLATSTFCAVGARFPESRNDIISRYRSATVQIPSLPYLEWHRVSRTPGVFLLVVSVIKKEVEHVAALLPLI